MKHPLVSLFFVLCAPCVLLSAEDGAKWLAEPPAPLRSAKKEEVLAADVFEVVKSKAEVAIGRLEKKEFVELSERDAKSFTGVYYSCPEGKKPFLVRAVFGYGGTGRYDLRRVGDALWVSHRSLGDEFVAWRSALVVNLPFSPAAVYATVSVAR